MSLVRAALHARPRPANTILFLQRRPASSTISHPQEEHHDEHHDSEGTEYPKEGGFLTPFWRNTFIFSVLVTGFYKCAPAPGEDTFLTQYLAQFNTSKEAWARINEKHVLDVTAESERLLLQASAQRPKVHRYRYPQRFDFVSPHLAPVGSEIDMTGVVAKGSHE